MDKCPKCGDDNCDKRNAAGCIARQLTIAQIMSAEYARQLAAANERAGRLEKALKRVGSNLMAAVSLLENSPKTGAASDKMFDIMLSDYRKAIEFGREVLKEVPDAL